MRLQPSPQQEHRHQSWQIGLLRGGGLWVGDASCHRSSARDEPMIDCLQHGPFPIVRANPSGPIPNKLRTLGWHLGFLSLTLIDQERLFGERRITSKFRASSELNQLHANLKKDPLQTCWDGALRRHSRKRESSLFCTASLPSSLFRPCFVNRKCRECSCCP